MITKAFMPSVIVAFATHYSCQMPRNQVLLLNVETSPASFSLSCDERQTWKPATLEADARRRFRCDMPGNSMWIHLNTDLPGEIHKESVERLNNGQRYDVYFDSAAKTWNIRQEK